MKSGVSEIVGQALLSDGTKADAYRALRPLICASCGGVVAAQAMFTRAAVGASGQGLHLWPRCHACVPFALAPAGPKRSPLLQSLLAPTEQEETAANLTRNATEQAKDDKRGNSVEAMRRRLGPALEHSRRSRSGS
jgi:hypothetical protein